MVADAITVWDALANQKLSHMPVEKNLELDQQRLRPIRAKEKTSYSASFPL